MEFESYITNFDKEYDKRIESGVSREFLCAELNGMIHKYLLFSPNSLENMDSFVNHLDIILKYAMDEYISWTDIKTIYKHPFFVHNLALELDNYCYFYDSIRFLILIYYKMGKDSSLFTEEMLDKICSLNADPYMYVDVYNIIDDNQKSLLFRKFAKYGLEINFSKYDLTDEILSYIRMNPVLFLKLSYDYIFFYKLVKDDTEALRKLDDYFAGNIDELLKYVLNEPFLDMYDGEAKSLIFDTVKKVIINENVGFSGIKWLGGGSSAYILNIGDKILKICYKRDTVLIKDSSNIIRPVIREEYEDDVNYLFIEVVEETDVNDDLDKEEVYKVFERLMDEGIVWDDAHASNIGILRKKNVVYWNSEIDLSNKKLKLIPNDKELKVLDKGEYVLIDLDYLFDYEDVKSGKVKYIHYIKYLNRYEREHGLKLTKKQ